MHVEILASSISDNFFYLLHDDGAQAVLIDPVDGAQAVEYLRQQELELGAVVNTHYHPDHIGGNDTVFKAYPDATLLAGAVDAEQIEARQSHPVDRRLHAGDAVQVGAHTVRVLDTPGHTLGHISLLGERALLSGDTIFAGGVGNCSFGGDPGVLYKTFRDVISALSDSVVFYPGHDYARRNLEFIVSLEPDNERANTLLSQEKAHLEAIDSAKQQSSERTFRRRTLGEERAYNPFFRVENPDYIEQLESEQPAIFSAELENSATRPEAAFRTLRTLRNDW